MTQDEIVKDCVHNRNRLEVTPKDYLKKCTLKIWSNLIISILLAAAFMFMSGFTFESIAIGAIFLIVVARILMDLMKSHV